MTRPGTFFALLRPALAAAAALGALCAAPAPLRAADVTVAIRSLNPDAGVAVGACCGDVCTLQVTPTPYDLVCPSGSTVNLSAAPTSGIGENEAFTEWRWGTPASFFTANRVTQIQVTGNASVTAVYGTPPPVVTHPDFRIDSIVLDPPSPLQNTPFTATITVSNHGESHLGLGYLAIWKDRADEPPCRSAKDAFNAFSVPAGESRTLTFADLVATSPGDLTFRAYADYNCGFDEADEIDNHATLPYTVRPRRTLQVLSTPTGGVPVIVGAADTLGRTDGTTAFSRFYADGTTTTLEVPPSLSSGYLFQSWLIDGAWYSDARLVTVEMLADHVLTALYVPPPIPDFSITDLTAMPASPTAGFAFSASVTVKNTGPVAGDAGTLALWADKVSNPNCNFSDANFWRSVGTLEPGESRTFLFSSVGPVASGTRYLRAHADAMCTTAEFSDTNNQRTTSYLAVTRTTTTLTVGTLDGRAAEIEHTMDVSGKTTGQTPFTRAYPLNTVVTLTAPATLPASSGVFQKWTGLEPTLASDPSVTFNLNFSRGLRAVYVGPGEPDFAVTGLVLDPPAPPANGTFTATVTITNVGTGRGVPGTLDLFPDPSAPATCWAGTIYGPMYIYDLAAGASLTFTVPNIPSGAPGAKQLLAFVDSFCETGEPDEANNQVFASYEVVNVPPVLGAIGDRQAAEGAPLSFTVAATDANGDALTYGATGLPDGAAFDPGTRAFSWTPRYDQAGAYPGVSFTVSDGTGGADEETITIDVAPTNRAPVLDPVGGRTGAEGAEMTIGLAAADPDLDPLTFAVENAPAGSNFDPANGVFRWTPGYDQAGAYPGVRFTVSDGMGGADGETITITVAPTNRAPRIGPVGDLAAVEGEPLEVVVAADDPDGTGLLFSAENLPPWATLDPATGVLAGTPGFDQAGRHEGIVLTATDDVGAAATETIAIDVAAPPGPVFVDYFADLPAADPPFPVGAGGDGWLPLAGAWSRANGVYAATSAKTANLARVALLDPAALPLGAGVVQARVKLTSTATGPLGPNALIVFGFVDPDHYRWVRVTGARVQIGQKGTIDGGAGGAKRGAAVALKAGAWTRLAVRVEPDGWVRVFKGAAAKPLVEHRFLGAGGAPSVVPGGVGLATAKAKALFDDVVVWEDSALGPPAVPAGGR